MPAQIKRKTWDYGDNFELWIDDQLVETWSTKNFTLRGFTIVFAEKYGLQEDEIEVCAGADDTYRPTMPNHQSVFAVAPPASPAYDPRVESNDFDPDEY